MAPTRKRGTYVSALIFTIIPFCPSVLWSQLIAYYSTWRYCGLISGVWAAIGTLLVAFFYFPPPRVNSNGLSNKEILGQIDWLGGLLSISGLVLFMAGLQWGGYMVSISIGVHATCLTAYFSSTNGIVPMSWFHLSLVPSSSSASCFGKYQRKTSIPCFLTVYDKTRACFT